VDIRDKNFEKNGKNSKQNIRTIKNKLLPILKIDLFNFFCWFLENPEVFKNPQNWEQVFKTLRSDKLGDQ
jgi:hypothetical protein